MATNLAAKSASEPEDNKDESTSIEKVDRVSDEPSQDKLTTASGKKKSADGFFTVYKYGQGKWTRLGTLAVAGVLGVMTTFNIFEWLVAYWPGMGVDPIASRRMSQIFLGVSVLFLVGFGVLVFNIANRPTNVDFLIATDSEMKKVNWTTKGELLGSTRVVVLFLFFIALFLFVVDLIFSEFFQLIGVLLRA
jgi:preprotein translocase SecE subunit